MYIVNGWRNICSALRVDSLISKGMQDMSKAKRLLTDDVNMTFQSAPCACKTLTLSAYYGVNK